MLRSGASARRSCVCHTRPTPQPDLHAATTPTLRSAFTPTGTLRAAINLGNPILAGRDAAGQPAGVSVDLARAFAQTIGAEVELVLVDSAGKSVGAVAGEQADIGFFAIDPLRAEHIAFTAPYVLIEGCYLVREDSPLRANEEVDRAGHRVVVGLGGAYVLYLTRTLNHAHILRSATSPAVVDTFVEPGRGRRRRGQAAARSRCAPPRRPAPAGRACHGDRAGDGHAQEPRARGRRLPRQLCRDHESPGMHRCGAAATRNRRRIGGAVGLAKPGAAEHCPTQPVVFS